MMFFNQHVIYIWKDERLAEIALELGTEMRNNSEEHPWLRWDGRVSKTSNAIQQYDNGLFQPVGLCHHRYKVAHIYDGRFAMSATRQSMKILGNAMTVQSLTEKCSNAEQSGQFLVLFDYLNSTYYSSNQTSDHVMRAACYHQGEPYDSLMPTFFPFHVDKAFVHTAWFVPLSSQLFFTIVAVPITWQSMQDAQSSVMFNEWMSSITCDHKRIVQSFMDAMKTQATTITKESKLLIYACNIGSFLSFPANTCLHGTIIPGFSPSIQSHWSCRDLLIVHPLELVSIQVCQLLISNVLHQTPVWLTFLQISG